MRKLATLSLALALTLAACGPRPPVAPGTTAPAPTPFQVKVDLARDLFDKSKPLIETGLPLVVSIDPATVAKAEADADAAFVGLRAATTIAEQHDWIDKLSTALATIKPAIEAAIAGASPETIAKVHAAEAVLEVGIAELRVLGG